MSYCIALSEKTPSHETEAEPFAKTVSVGALLTTGALVSQLNPPDIATKSAQPAACSRDWYRVPGASERPVVFTSTRCSAVAANSTGLVQRPPRRHSCQVYSSPSQSGDANASHPTSTESHVGW